MNDNQMLIDNDTKILLSDDQKALIEKYIVKIGNKIKACAKADIHVLTFNKAMKKGSLKKSQADILIQFAQAVKSNK